MTREETKYIVIHCTATKTDHDVTAALVDEWHKARGWSGIGYHFLIRRSGLIEPGRDIRAVGAHTKGHNKVSVGIALAGGVDSDSQPDYNFTVSQMNSLRALVKTCSYMYPKATVLGHRDLSPDVDGDGVIGPHEWVKACPCFEVRTWWETVT